MFRSNGNISYDWNHVQYAQSKEQIGEWKRMFGGKRTFNANRNVDRNAKREVLDVFKASEVIILSDLALYLLLEEDLRFFNSYVILG